MTADSPASRIGTVSVLQIESGMNLCGDQALVMNQLDGLASIEWNMPNTARLLLDIVIPADATRSSGS